MAVILKGSKQELSGELDFSPITFTELEAQSWILRHGKLLSLNHPKGALASPGVILTFLFRFLFSFVFEDSICIQLTAINKKSVPFYHIQATATDPHHHQRQYGLSWGHLHGHHHTLTSDDVGVLECLSESWAFHSRHSEHLQHEARA